MRTIAQGRGAILKCKQFPDLAAVMECLFCTEGLETHPRLIDTVLYRSKSNTLTMKHAREALLSLSPNGFSISLSSCYNYTQNYKAGTAQAKRHHDGQDITLVFHSTMHQESGFPNWFPICTGQAQMSIPF